MTRDRHAAPADTLGASRAALGLGVALILTLAPVALAQETDRLMLSGTGFGDEVAWEFSVTGGRRAGEKATIPVPSQWEQHGFGAYNYGHDDDKAREQGHYRHRFRVPATWRGKTVDLVFEGVMTDTEARVNGSSVGPVHRGGFYRFRYDVTDLLELDGDNLLEVTVSKHSSDKSVNKAEREADYWVFGGIYRPVYLEARPPESIDHVAIDARHDGTLTAAVRLRSVAGPGRVVGRVETQSGQAVGASFSAEVGGDVSEVELRTRLDAVSPWSAESPVLYRLILELESGGEVVHRLVREFGFRTVELRATGLFVNDRRVLLKGINRHAFWPASGRTLNFELDERDVELIKSLNMNAVRMSHYPPDTSFLEACDRRGLYVIDELAGWHDAYATGIGRTLVREMVERDVNHPSVILWANGNEDGWNTALDRDFAEHDPQQRAVIHPRSTFGGFDADHYPTWSELWASFDPGTVKNRWRSFFGQLPLVMPTELLHGLYDGGSGAGLEDYWRRIRTAPRGAGAFLWSFADEAIERTDRDGELDTDDNHAPDGVLGPYRELTGHYHAVREIFSPVQIHEQRFDGVVEVENRFDMTDLSACRFDWRLLDLPAPGGRIETLSTGTLDGPAVAPGRRGQLKLPPEIDWRAADALSLTARDAAGRELWTWVLRIREPRTALRPVVSVPGTPVAAIETDGRLILRSASATVGFDLETGRLLELAAGAGAPAVPFDGPHPVGLEQLSAARVHHLPRDAAHGVDVQYQDARLSAHWLLLPSGWLRLSYSFEAEGEKELFGLRFDVVEEAFEKLRWLGDGPGRVWKNRLRGTTPGLWEKEISAAARHPAGFYSGVVWAELTTAESRLLIAFEKTVPPEGGESRDPYLGLFSPDFPEDARDAVAAVPAGGISLLHGISAIGTKFHPPEDLGPQSQPTMASGRYRGVVWLKAVPRE